MATYVGDASGSTPGVTGNTTITGANGMRATSTTGLSAFYATNSLNGAAVHGAHTHPTNGGYGVYGSSSTGVGYGVYGTNSGGAGVYGTGATGVWGNSSSGIGIYGFSSSGTVGYAGLVAFGRDGVIGEARAGHPGAGIVGKGGVSPHGGNYAGYFIGPVHVTGFLTKAGGGFLIDHPVDPANRLLEHSFVESPDRKNVYDGIGTADAAGELTVKLPAYFEALNKDFRYQLTPIGKAAPGLYVKREVRNNEFVVAGAEPGQRVCWQVTGIRKDAFAEATPLVVERDKPADERGFYLNPAAHGQPPEKGLDVKRHGGPSKAPALPPPPPPPPDQP